MIGEFPITGGDPAQIGYYVGMMVSYTTPLLHIKTTSELMLNDTFLRSPSSFSLKHAPCYTGLGSLIELGASPFYS
jgi:hypothetical protein